MQSSISVFKHVYTISSLIMLMLLLMITTSCSSSDGGGSVNIQATVPDQLSYEIRQVAGISLSLEQAGAQATITSTLLTGTFNRITEAFTLNTQPAAMTVSAMGFLGLLDAALGSGIDFSNYSLHVTTAAAWVGDGNPTSGEFEIFDNDFRKITVTVNPNVNNSGIAGVDIIYWPDGEGSPGTSQSISVTWDIFDGVFDDNGAAAYARIASFAYSALRFMYEQGEIVILSLEAIGDFDTLLEQQGSVAESCDTYPFPPDQPVPDPGMSVLTWSDASLDGELGPGDSFSWNLTQCWDDDETDTIDQLLHGVINLAGYTEVVNAGIITRIGFEPFNGPGGIDFVGLELTETDTDANANQVIFDISDKATLNGGFSMVFTSP